MIELQNISKVFKTSDGEVEALKNVSLKVNDGDIFGIIGMSGAGKSTLVRCINMLERPSEGAVIIDGTDMGSLSQKELNNKRRKVSMIFQSFNLLMQRTCLANICFPMELAGINKADAIKRATHLLEVVGLPDKANAYPAQLSGGQQQRIAIARALATDPEVLLCDEATSALDPKTTHSILELIRKINKEMGITVIIITHQMSVVEEICSHVAIIDAGQVVEMGPVNEVFAHPRSDAAKHLVYPDGVEAVVGRKEGQHLIRVVYNGALVAQKPLIAAMALDIGVVASILGASTRSVGDMAYGNMLLAIEGGDEILAKTLEYLGKIPDISAEEV